MVVFLTNGIISGQSAFRVYQAVIDRSNTADRDALTLGRWCVTDRDVELNLEQVHNSI
jgi:hypothetical protein